MSSNQAGSPAANGWNLDARWEGRISGTSCEFCRWDEAMRATYPVEVARLRVSRWFLGANQYVRGYSVLVLDRHAVELYDLDTAVRQALTEDMADAGQALGRVLKPIKMNFELLGNVIPHLHCHLKPRHYYDRPGHARIFQDAQRWQVPLQQLEQLAAELKFELRK